MNKYQLLQCTQASRSGAAKYVNELFCSTLKLVPSVKLICPADYDYLEGVSPRNIIAFSKLGSGGALKKVVNMARQLFEVGVAIFNNSSKIASVVHFNFPGIPFLVVPLFCFLRFKKIKFVLTVHDVCPHRWLLPIWGRKIEIFTLKWMYKLPSRLVVHHCAQSKVLNDYFGIKLSSIHVIHHGVFPLNGAPLNRNASSNVVALCFGAIRENKGYDLAIKAVQHLRSQGAPIELLIAGAVSAGESEYWAFCKELIAKNPEGIIVREGYIPDAEISDIFSNSSFAFLPYSDFFSQSGVATMALSSGRPIVCTMAGGLSEFLQGGRFGIKIDDASLASVIASLEKCIQIGDGGLLKMGAAAHDEFLESYSWDCAARMHVDVYSALFNSELS